MKQITLILFLIAASVAYADKQNCDVAKFNIASYNIRCLTHEDSINGNTWNERSQIIAQIVKFHDFNIFGVQEAVKRQLNTLKSLLPEYQYIGNGRDDGKDNGEHAAIFFDTNLFNVEKHGNFWLSEHPNRPSIGWDAAYNRICTWGIFKHKFSGKRFFFMNLHLDHKGKTARLESIKLIKQKILDISQGLPIILSGDFNVDQFNICYEHICRFLNDSYTLSDIIYSTNGTFNGWKENSYTDSRIDHIFVSKNIKVKKYGILTDSFRKKECLDSLNQRIGNTNFGISIKEAKIKLPSDHFPIRISVEF